MLSLTPGYISIITGKRNPNILPEPLTTETFTGLYTAVLNSFLLALPSLPDLPPPLNLPWQQRKSSPKSPYLPLSSPKKLSTTFPHLGLIIMK